MRDFLLLFPDHTFPIPFVCRYCGKSQWEENGSVPVCDCPQSLNASVVLREATKALARQRQAQEPSLVELRQMRKLRTRKCVP